MLLVPCPWCGPRPEGEFTNLGEAGPPRPAAPEALDDAAWVAFVTGRANTRGLHRERWWHARGCGRIVAVERDTLTHDIRAVPAESAP